MLSKYLVKIVILHVQIFVLSKAGQRINNNIENLKRRVGKLLIGSLTSMYFNNDIFKSIIIYYLHV